jgi:hypothetical protein
VQEVVDDRVPVVARNRVLRRLDRVDQHAAFVGTQQQAAAGEVIDVGEDRGSIAGRQLVADADTANAGPVGEHGHQLHQFRRAVRSQARPGRAPPST